MNLDQAQILSFGKELTLTFAADKISWKAFLCNRNNVVKPCKTDFCFKVYIFIFNPVPNKNFTHLNQLQTIIQIQLNR